MRIYRRIRFYRIQALHRILSVIVVSNLEMVISPVNIGLYMSAMTRLFLSDLDRSLDLDRKPSCVAVLNCANMSAFSLLAQCAHS